MEREKNLEENSYVCADLDVSSSNRLTSRISPPQYVRDRLSNYFATNVDRYRQDGLVPFEHFVPFHQVRLQDSHIPTKHICPLYRPLSSKNRICRI